MVSRSKNKLHFPFLTLVQSPLFTFESNGAIPRKSTLEKQNKRKDVLMKSAI